MKDDKFDQAKYWSDRHRELEGDPRSVGNCGRSLEENYQAEDHARDMVRAAITTLGEEPKRTVLDLGCGYGRLVQPFLDAGWEYHGVDVSDLAVERARKDYPGATFEVSDLLSWKPSATYDVVCLFWVLVHFVNEDDWRRMVEVAVSAVAPGGTLLLADEMADSRRAVAQHVVVRSIPDYEPLLGRLGFSFEPALREDFMQRVRSGGDMYFIRRFQDVRDHRAASGDLKRRLNSALAGSGYALTQITEADGGRLVATLEIAR